MASRKGVAPVGVCRKVRHETKGAAKKAQREMMAGGSRRLEPYRCEVCEGWHLGHRPGQTKKG